MTTKTVATTVTYLEMKQRPSEPVLVSPDSNVTIERETELSAQAYRELYQGVGQDYTWTERVLMDDSRLEAIIRDRRVGVYVLRVAGQAAGYIELDDRVPGETEIAYFGVFPAFYGRKLGIYLLAWAIERAFQQSIERLWLHTCSLDHAAALPTYQKVGFVIYDEQEETVRLLEE